MATRRQNDRLPNVFCLRPLIAHLKRALQIIPQKISVSLTVKAAFVLLTILGHATLWTAIAADMGVSLVVVFNVLRLLRANNFAA